MKCLSISQPFAFLIVTGKKTIELRSWNTHFRGEFLIHAPLKIRTLDCKRLKINPHKLIVGAIIGKAELYDVIQYGSPSHLKKDSKKHLASKNFHSSKYGFCLKKPKQFRIPIPTKGKLGFFDVKLQNRQVSSDEIISDLIDEEYRYQWIGRH